MTISRAAGGRKEKLLADEEEVLQAVVLADSFNRRFRPLTTQKPRCLLPICNAPLLDWTFESLALAGVQEVFVVCRSHADLVKKAIADSKWSKPGSGMKIVPIMTAKSTYSPGDAMRDIYTRGLVTSDFVLVMGDLVSNIRIDEVVRVHKERRKTNKDAIMTMVVKESGLRHRTRARGDSGVFVYDPETSECLHYQHTQAYPSTKDVVIPREILAEHSELEIRNDLIDCSIDVCSVEVPSLFQDNFDYLDIRRDFVHGVLTSDLLMKNIHIYIAKDGYAARVQDTRSYASVSKDILSRWTFPLVPDDNHPGGHIYELTRGNRYISKDNSVVLARTANVGTNTLIGSSTQISDNVTIVASVIGQHCTIGPGSTISNSYIFENSIIGANCTIEQSIIGSGVRIKEGSVVPKGCLIGDGVVIGPNAKLEAFDRLSIRRADAALARRALLAAAPARASATSAGEKTSKATSIVSAPTKRREAGDDDEDDEDDEDEEEVRNDDGYEAGNDVDGDGDMSDEDDASDIEEVEDQQDTIDKATLGTDSNAVLWPRGEPKEEEEPEGPENWKNQRFMRLGDTASDLDVSDAGSSSSDEDTSSDTDDDMGGDYDSVSGRSDISIPMLDIAGASNLVQKERAEAEFQNEVAQSLERAFAEGHSVENAAVELKTLRMASNVPLLRVKEGVIAAIVERIPVVEGNPAAQHKHIGDFIGRWGELVDKIGGRDSVETITILQAHCASSVRLPLFGQILAAFYQEDIVEEDDIRKWHKSAAAKGEEETNETVAENLKKCWTIGSHLLKRLEEQEDSSEEESDSDEDAPAPRAAPAKAQSKAKEESDSDEDSGSDSDAPTKAPSTAPVKAKDETTSDDDSDSDAPAPTSTSKPTTTTNPPAKVATKEESESESESDAPAPTPSSSASAAAKATSSASEDTTTTDDDSESDAPPTTASGASARDLKNKPRVDHNDGDKSESGDDTTSVSSASTEEPEPSRVVPPSDVTTALASALAAVSLTAAPTVPTDTPTAASTSTTATTISSAASTSAATAVPTVSITATSSSSTTTSPSLATAATPKALFVIPTALAFGSPSAALVTQSLLQDDLSASEEDSSAAPSEDEGGNATTSDAASEESSANPSANASEDESE